MEDNKDGRDEKGRFTLGNLWWMHSKQGAEPLYESPEAMTEEIGNYLIYEEKTSKGKYTLSGLALYLGFASRQSMYDYEQKSPAFAYAINRFRLFMQHYHEQRLTWAGSFQGSFVWLKNFGGYTDEVTQHQNQTITQVSPTVVQSQTPFANNEKDIEP
jgi:hypothetical protein